MRFDLENFNWQSQVVNENQNAKVEKIFKGSLDLISSPSPSVKI